MKIRNEYNSMKRFKQVPDFFLTLDNRVSTILILYGTKIKPVLFRAINFGGVERAMKVTAAIVYVRFPLHKPASKFLIFYLYMD